MQSRFEIQQIVNNLTVHSRDGNGVLADLAKIQIMLLMDIRDLLDPMNRPIFGKLSNSMIGQTGGEAKPNE